MLKLEKAESIQDSLIVSLWVFVAGLIWSIIVVVISLFLWNNTDIFAGFRNSGSRFGTNVETLYPIVLSFVTLAWTTITCLLTYFILWMTNSERYKRNNVIFVQVALFQILIFVFILPVYVFFWGTAFQNILITYICHVLIVIFWTNMILDILNNYRYVLISIYWNFIWLFISIFVAIAFFYIFSDWYAKLFSLVFLLPIVNFITVFVKKFFEFVYYHFYRITWSDPIWDIFHKIKLEDEENEKEEAQKNMI